MTATSKPDKYDLYAEENEPKSKQSGAFYDVNVPGSVKMADSHSRASIGITVRVYSDGLLNLDRYRWFGVHGPKHGGYRLSDPKDKLLWETEREILDWLVEWELAKLVRVGPEDSEYFATSKLTGDEADDRRHDGY